MRWGAILSTVLIGSACGGLKSTHDAGPTGGGSATGGGGTSTGGGTGTAGGSGTAGGGTAGGSAMLRYAALSIPSVNGLYIAGISGRSGELYAVSDSNGLFRSTGGGFTEIIGTTFNSGSGVYVASNN